MAVLANTDYEGEIRQQGDTVQVRTYGSVTVQDYQRGMTIAAEDLVPTKEAMTVGSAKYFAFDVDDLDRAQNDLSAVQGYTSRAGVALANHIDSYLLAFHASALAANKITGGGGAAINIDANGAGTAVYELLVDAGTKLDDQSVPLVDRWAIISPYAKGLCLKSTTYLIRASELGDQVVTSGGLPARDAARRGFLGQMAGFNIWVSTNLPTNGANRYLVYGQGKPVSYAAQIPPGTLESMRLESTFATRVRGLLLHGGKVFAEQSKQLGTIYVDNS
jgi:hypothetical protein